MSAHGPVRGTQVRLTARLQGGHHCSRRSTLTDPGGRRRSAHRCGVVPIPTGSSHMSWPMDGVNQLHSSQPTGIETLPRGLGCCPTARGAGSVLFRSDQFPTDRDFAMRSAAMHTLGSVAGCCRFIGPSSATQHWSRRRRGRGGESKRRDGRSAVRHGNPLLSNDDGNDLYQHGMVPSLLADRAAPTGNASPAVTSRAAELRCPLAR